MDEQHRMRQLAHIDECIALCDRSPTSSEILRAASHLDLKPNLAPGARLETRHRRVCLDCLRAYRSKHRGARKPWPDRLYHFIGGRHCERHAAARAEQGVRQQAKRGLRAVSWADRSDMRDVYTEAAKRRAGGERVHVDHVIPLLGKKVSGLHVAANLAVIPASENIRKGNKF